MHRLCNIYVYVHPKCKIIVVTASIWCRWFAHTEYMFKCLPFNRYVCAEETIQFAYSTQPPVSIKCEDCEDSSSELAITHLSILSRRSAKLSKMRACVSAACVCRSARSIVIYLRNFPSSHTYIVNILKFCTRAPHKAYYVRAQIYEREYISIFNWCRVRFDRPTCTQNGQYVFDRIINTICIHINQKYIAWICQ